MRVRISLGEGPLQMVHLQSQILMGKNFRTFPGGQDAAFVEGIEKNISMSDNEVARKVDSIHGHSGRFPIIIIKNRKRNRNAKFAIDDSWKERVSGVVIVVCIAMKTKLHGPRIEP